MRAARLVLLFVLILSPSPRLNSQQSTTIPQRDAQAISVMSQMAAATGWGTAGLPSDALASGTVTRYKGDVQDIVNVILKAKGSKLYRAQVQEPLLSFADPSFAVQYLGTETIANQTTHRIAISPQPSSSDPAAPLRSRANRLVVWISESSGFPLQIAYVRISTDNPTASRLVTRAFSDYRVVNGIAVPFHQDEFGGEQRSFSLQLTTVILNAGLRDTDFALPVLQD